MGWKVIYSYICLHQIQANRNNDDKKKEPDPMTNCSKDDQGNYYCDPKNRSIQTDKLQQRDHGVQTVSYSQSSSASQTACFLDITSRLRPFSDDKTDINSYRSSAPTTYPSRLMKLKLDGPIIHGPFSCCDCPGGVDFCKHDRS